MNLEQLEQQRNRLQVEIKDRERSLAFLSEHETFLTSIGCNVLTYYGIRFEQPSREDAIAIIKHLGGKWDKTYDEAVIHYSQSTPERGYLTINGAPPPASCRIEEETVVVPSHYVPERVEKRRKLVCIEPKTPSPDSSDSQDDSSSLLSPPVPVDIAGEPRTHLASSADPAVPLLNLEAALDETSQPKYGDL